MTFERSASPGNAIPEQGYLYLVYGSRQYVDEALQSCRSLRAVSPGAHATVVVDRLIPELRARLAAVFDEVREGVAAVDGDEFGSRRQPWHYGLTFKVRNMHAASPYRRTFFVDTDTYFVEPTDGLFDLLEYFDLVLTPAPGDLAEIRNSRGEVMTGYTPYNTGVIAFDRERTRELFASWARLQHEAMASDRENAGTDQETFAAALLESSARFCVLQPSWNARLPYPARFAGRVRIAHAHASELGGLTIAAAARRANRTDRLRVWLPGVNEVVYPGMGTARWLLVAAKSLAHFAREDLRRARRLVARRGSALFTRLRRGRTLRRFRTR
jgi:hypothetical protein